MKASKIAVLMMLEDALPFAAVWSRSDGCAAVLKRRRVRED